MKRNAFYEKFPWFFSNETVNVYRSLQISLFSFSGVAAGSLAASVQSVVYSGATTGAFSVLQSAGAAGLAGKTLLGVGALAGGAVGCVNEKFR